MEQQKNKVCGADIDNRFPIATILSRDECKNIETIWHTTNLGCVRPRLAKLDRLSISFKLGLGFGRIACPTIRSQNREGPMSGSHRASDSDFLRF